MTTRGLPLRIAVLVAVALVACRSDEKSAVGVSERFIDAHYVNINLTAAVPFCTGIALRKLQEEQRLTQGQRIDETTRKPTVRYRLIDKKEEDGDHATFIFEGTIQVEDAGQFKRKWLISTRRTGDVWKVSNFEEFD
jgi:hypothetical protein